MLFVGVDSLIRVMVANGEAAAAKRLKVLITLPESFYFVSSDVPVEVNGNEYTVNRSSLPTSTTLVVNLTVKPLAEGTYTSHVVASVDNPLADGSIVEDEQEHLVVDVEACAITTIVGPSISISGGDTFNCYPLGELPLPYNAGTNWGGDWCAAEFPVIYGDDFQSYSVQDPLIDDLNGGTGFDGKWCLT